MQAEEDQALEGDIDLDNANDAEREQAMEDELSFSERTLPREPFQFQPFVIYLVFLMFFCIVTIGRQGSAPYMLARFARDQIGEEHFMQVHGCPSRREGKRFYMGG